MWVELVRISVVLQLVSWARILLYKAEGGPGDSGTVSVAQIGMWIVVVLIFTLQWRELIVLCVKALIL